MPFKRRFKRRPRRNRRKLRLTRNPSASSTRVGGSIVPFVRRFLDQDTTPNASYSGLDLNTDVKMSQISGYSDIAAVFKWYRINKVKVTYQISTNFAQSGMVDNNPPDQLFMVYWRRKQIPTDTLTTLTEQQLLEKGDVKRKMFNSKGQVSFYYTPNTWQNLNAPSAPVNTGQRKIFKQWFLNTDADNASSAIIHSGCTGTLIGANNGNLPYPFTVKSYYTIYGQFKTMV